jgi:hypothetical protein
LWYLLSSGSAAISNVINLCKAKGSTYNLTEEKEFCGNLDSHLDSHNSEYLKGSLFNPLVKNKIPSKPGGVVVKHSGLWTRRREFESLPGYFSTNSDEAKLQVALSLQLFLWLKK